MPVQTYDERLRPPGWLWAVATTLVLLFGVSVYAALGPVAGLVTVAVLGGAVAWGLVSSAAVVRVEDGLLTAGRARIPVSALGPVAVLDAGRARAVRGPESDPAGYHLIRGWVPAGVQAAVVDPSDSTPYWFVATRHPGRLAAAIEAARLTPPPLS